MPTVSQELGCSCRVVVGHAGYEKMSDFRRPGRRGSRSVTHPVARNPDAGHRWEVRYVEATDASWDQRNRPEREQA